MKVMSKCEQSSFLGLNPYTLGALIHLVVALDLNYFSTSSGFSIQAA
jgi:hypothetical protein